jgi:tRNA(fMet)-specific endonuclease VapC
MRYLIDTNICIYVIKRSPDKVLKRFCAALAGEIGISSVTLFELAYGVGRSMQMEKSLQALKDFSSPLEVLPFDEHDALEAGLIRATLALAGRPIGPYDLQIAAQARRRGLILVSNNLREFERVDGLKLENWI